MASILSRVADIMDANVNAFLDSCENPEKMIDKLLRDAKENLATVKRESAEVIAQETAAQRALDAEKEKVREYTNAAKAALSAGNEADALTLAERIAKKEVDVANAQKVLDMAKANADKMRGMYKKLTDDTATLEGRRANLKGLMAATRAQEAVNKATSKVGNGVGGKLTDMEAKIQKKFDAAQAYSKLDDEVGDEAENLLDKYTGSTAANDILAKLRGEVAPIGDASEPMSSPSNAREIVMRLNAEILTENK